MLFNKHNIPTVETLINIRLWLLQKLPLELVDLVLEFLFGHLPVTKRITRVFHLRYASNRVSKLVTKLAPRRGRPKFEVGVSRGWLNQTVVSVNAPQLDKDLFPKEWHDTGAGASSNDSLPLRHCLTRSKYNPFSRYTTLERHEFQSRQQSRDAIRTGLSAVIFEIRAQSLDGPRKTSLYHLRSLGYTRCRIHLRKRVVYHEQKCQHRLHDGMKCKCKTDHISTSSGLIRSPQDDKRNPNTSVHCNFTSMHQDASGEAWTAYWGRHSDPSPWEPFIALRDLGGEARLTVEIEDERLMRVEWIKVHVLVRLDLE